MYRGGSGSDAHGAQRGDAAARRAGNEPLLQQIGLVDIANRVGFLDDRGSKRIDSDEQPTYLNGFRASSSRPLR